jgi:peptidoglycan hydrolase-like protein with peptidoglycan-binding domain
MARRKKVEFEMDEPDEDSGVNPLPVVLWSVSAIAGLFIVYNVFAGQPLGTTQLAQDQDPSNISIAGRNTVILRYDADIEEVQRQLLATGHYRGLVDGVTGNRTRLAIEAYQRDNNLPVSAIVTPELIEHIRFTAKFAAAAEYTASTDQSVPKAASTASAETTRMISIQKALADLGYQPGEATGSVNAATRSAIRKFETENSLAVDGEIDDRVLAQLSKTTGYENLLPKPVN